MSIKKTDKKHHISSPDFEAGYNGMGPMHLSEPVPNFKKRPGDKVIQANVDNNTIIVLGRDRAPFRKTTDGKTEKAGTNPLDIETVSGYSDFMGAGAIDMVVGRGAPYPVESILVGGNKVPLNLPPLYLTRDDLKLKGTNLRDGSTHDGTVMDAARIYISQMSDIDDYFAIKQATVPIDRGPSSAIMLKADKLRMHSRRDIKIVAGGDKGTNIDSNGFEITETGKIHLIAGNGRYGPQQPIPVGHNLAECLEEVMGTVQGVLELLNNFLLTQKTLNGILSNAVYVTAVGPSTQNPLAQSQNVVSTIEMQRDMIQIHAQKFINIPSLINNYLKPSGPKYINSRHTTTT